MFNTNVNILNVSITSLFFNFNQKIHNLIFNPFSWSKHFIEKTNVNNLEVFDKCEEMFFATNYINECYNVQILQKACVQIDGGKLNT